MVYESNIYVCVYTLVYYTLAGIILVILSKCAYDGCVFHIMQITTEEYAYYELVAIILERDLCIILICIRNDILLCIISILLYYSPSS